MITWHFVYGKGIPEPVDGHPYGRCCRLLATRSRLRAWLFALAARLFMQETWVEHMPVRW